MVIIKFTMGHVVMEAIGEEFLAVKWMNICKERSKPKDPNTRM